MMKISCKHILLCFLGVCILLTPPLQSEDILKILEGYGRDSISAYTEDSAQEEAARLFNLILDPDGEIVVTKAEQYLSSCKSDIVRSYLCVILADYAFVNKHDNNGLNYLRRAVKEYDPIRNDSYYRLVLSRAQKIIAESPGKEMENKKSVLENYSPAPVKEEPPLKTVSEGEKPLKQRTAELPAPIDTAEGEAEQKKTANYRIQVGAYSLRDNALQKEAFYKNKGFSTLIETRQGGSGTLYLVRIGAYEEYNEARQALSVLKDQDPSEEGIVVKVEKK